MREVPTLAIQRAVAKYVRLVPLEIIQKFDGLRLGCF